MVSRALVRNRAGTARARTASARRGDSHEQVAEMQRSRLLAATVRTVEELGYAHTTVANITRRARVSRRTFYDLFANREDCLVAVLEDAALRVGSEIDQAGLAELPWRERIRGGLWTILSFLDREPVLARVCVVQALRGSQGMLERREEILRALARALDEGRGESARGSECPPLTAEGLVGAAFAIVYARLLRSDPDPFAALFPELMGMIVLPYFGPAAARREQARPVPAPVAEHTANGHALKGTGTMASVAGDDPLQGIPMRLTYRTARVLEAIGQRPGVSNRIAGDLAGVSDQGQISKLLARLERLGLAENADPGHARGERNEWRLTERGALVTQALRAHAATVRG